MAFFAIGYLLNMFYITVFYHRGLAHKAVEMPQRTKRFIYSTGIWVTGIDPKAWCCMHRMHHSFSDTEQDPHTPNKCTNLAQMFSLQLKSYKTILVGLIKNDKEFTHLVSDLDIDVHWLNKTKKWYLPYLLHIGIALVIGLLLSPWIGLFYLLGIMSHPIQGALVNYFGHKSGYRNFDIEDNSKNNLLVALFTMGEGYQNNHHHRPHSAKFGVKWFEIDFGYFLCKVAKTVGIIKTIHK
jgi:stearoyl-CoA desaturase (delta-9 desaturase)